MLAQIRPHGLEAVEAKMAPGGRIVTYDPIQIWAPIVLLRRLFRPFQTDAAWEHPFGLTSISQIQNRFEVLAVQGVMGKSKWASVVGLVSPALGRQFAQRWHDDDLRRKTNPASIGNCLHVSYHLRKKGN